MPGTRTDLVWEPMPLASVVRLLEGAPFTWWIAGGWALDLHRGRQSRAHGDTDIGVSRHDQAAVQRYFASEWRLYVAHDGKLTPWLPGEWLPSPKDDIWISRNAESPWTLQTMLVNIVKGQWLYKRLPSIRRAFDDTLLHTPDGIPYLRPEIQLLYKGGKPVWEDKAWRDLHTMLPVLTAEERAWLRSSLAAQFPEGHAWIDALDS